MAKVRAYKLAEELGIERNEFVEKAAAVGVELKSAMSALDEEQITRLREKLGSSEDRKKFVTEKRVDAKGGAVIRRRRKVAPEPPPEPEPEEAPAPAVEVAPEPVAEPVPAVAEPAAPEPEPEPEPEVTPAPVQQPVPAPAPLAARAADSEAARAGPERSGGAKQRKLVREVVNLREQETLARQATRQQRRQVVVTPRQMISPRRKRRDAPQPSGLPAPRPAKEVKRVARIDGSVSVGELARMLGAKAPEVQKKLMALGTMVSINQSIDFETARKVSAEFGFEVQDVGFDEKAFLEESPAERDESKLVSRAPVVTVMGHVDHGKTSLLDALRQTKVVEGEAGGITQHVGAYRVEIGGKQITFIDTPGHAAFTAMRARGAQVTDVVILVVAATEGVMPQTIEAIEHAQAAGVPIVVAINKCDLPGANPQQTRQRLMEHNLVPEEFGGDVICVDVSAKKRTGLEQLLEMVSLQGEVLELKADPSVRAKGVVLEAALDKGRGAVATVLIQEGTLHRGDAIVAGSFHGRVRTLLDENGTSMKEAGPSVPVQVVGLSAVPDAGQAFNAVENERVAKEIVSHRQDQVRTQGGEARPAMTLDEFFEQAEGGTKELSIVIKGDVGGSVEALREALLKLSTDDVKVSVLSAGVGAVTESDVMLAKASGAIIVAFHVRPDPAARRAAEEQGVDIRAYRVIYEVTEDVQKAMLGLLPPTVSEEFMGRAEVRQTFTVPRVGTIAGSYVAEGLVRRNASCRLLRDGVQIYEGRIGSLKRFKDDAREVSSGFECGIGIEGFNDVKVGDVIEAFAIEEKPPTL